MDGAWELLTVCHVLNLNLSPIWLLLFLCPSVNVCVCVGGGLYEERVCSSSSSPQLELSPDPSPGSRELPCMV